MHESFFSKHPDYVRHSRMLSSFLYTTCDQVSKNRPITQNQFAMSLSERGVKELPTQWLEIELGLQMTLAHESFETLLRMLPPPNDPIIKRRTLEKYSLDHNDALILQMHEVEIVAEDFGSEIRQTDLEKELDGYGNLFKIYIQQRGTRPEQSFSVSKCDVQVLTSNYEEQQYALVDQETHEIYAQIIDSGDNAEATELVFQAPQLFQYLQAQMIIRKQRELIGQVQKQIWEIANG